MSKKERLIIILLASINFTHILDFMIMMPLGNYLMPFFDISLKQFSFLIGSYPIIVFFRIDSLTVQLPAAMNHRPDY